ncbi:Uncharacterized protein DAT39_020362 [Clarias magur]|uniref:Uncharacterized protein n=1 Tax=Clarias magur TaxID=1594786 RepID=A0A8J4WSK6_CLAMG|nr:Uncharacterized protein DAT39_020362 [Clarias magur]
MRGFSLCKHNQAWSHLVSKTDRRRKTISEKKRMEGRKERQRDEPLSSTLCDENKGMLGYRRDQETSAGLRCSLGAA